MYVALLTIVLLTTVGVVCLVVYSPDNTHTVGVWRAGNCTDAGIEYAEPLSHKDCMTVCFYNTLCHYAVRLVGGVSPCYMSTDANLCQLLPNNTEYETVARSAATFV